MKKIGTMLAALLLMAGTTANAQTSESSEFSGHWFLQLQGGANYNLDNPDFSKLITPAAQIAAGYQFTPVFGLRLGVNGFKAKGGFKNNETYEWKYITPALDLRFNLVNAFGYNPRRIFGLNLILGGGVNIGWDNDENVGKHFGEHALNNSHYTWSGTKARFVGRAGLDFDFRVAKNVSINLEAMVNGLSDKYNSQPDNSHEVDLDWYFTGLLGVKIDLGKKSAPQRVVDETPLSLYEQKEQGVDQRMATWMKRMKGESKTDYLARTSNAAMQSQRLEFSKTISTQMAGNRAQTSVNDLRYNTKDQLLGIGFGDMPSITLRVPREEVRDIKGTSDLQFTNTVYDLNPGDKFEVLYTDVIIPSTGKKYTYISTRDAHFVKSDAYQPLSAVQEALMNSQRLQQVATDAHAQVQSKDVQVDNTTVTVSTEVQPKSNGKADYKVSYTYTVKDGFSASDDFEAGKYDADKTKASVALLRVINESLSGEFAKYVKAGASVLIKYQGSADASPIHAALPYNGRYGNIKDQAVTVNGRSETMTITRASGITTNEQLSLLRAISVRNYILKNVKALKDMQVNDSFSVEVAPTVGSEYRRVSVEFLFPDAY